MEDGLPVLCFKKNLMMNTWKGLRNSPEHGLQVLVEILSTVPEILLPQKLPEKDLENILNFPQILAIKKQFWATFGDNQFPETFGILPEGWEEDFWLVFSTINLLCFFGVAKNSKFLAIYFENLLQKF
jgi:hypothetical protein